MATELDYMEYATDAAAQAAYVSSEIEGVEESFETGTNGDYGIGDAAGTDYWIAQKIITAKAITCIAASIYLGTRAGTIVGDLTFRLETEVDSKPSGVLAHANATSTIANASISDNAWNKCSFTAFTLAADTYWLVTYLPDQANDTKLRWLLTTTAGANYRAHSTDHAGNWTLQDGKCYFRLYGLSLQCYSENSIKQQGSYSLKGFAETTLSLNETLTRTVDPTIDLSDLTMAHFFIYSNRTGSNIKVGIHDSGGTTSENTPSISSASTWEKQDWDISGISNANKDAIDSIIITVVNADADNTFYLDYFFAGPYAQSVTGTIGFTDAITKKTSRSLADTLAFTDAIAKKTKRALADVLAFTDALSKIATFGRSLADTIGFTDALTKKTKRSLADTIAFTDALTKKAKKSLADTIAFTDTLVKKIKKSLSDTISFTSRLWAWLEKGDPSSSYTEESDPSSS